MFKSIISICQKITPQYPDIDLLKKVIDCSNVLDTDMIIGITPIYIMNIVDYSPIYRSLIIEISGEIWVSIRSSDWIMNQWSNLVGCRYEYFCHFFHHTLNIEKKQVPFVWGNTCLIKINNRYNKMGDWLNISLCNRFDFYKTARKRQSRFYFKIDNYNFIIHLDYGSNNINNQILLALSMNRAWFVLNATTISKQRFPFSFQPFALFERKFDHLKLTKNDLPHIEPKLIQELILFSDIIKLCKDKKNDYSNVIQSLKKIDINPFVI